jgi:plastocyanin
MRSTSNGKILLLALVGAALVACGGGGGGPTGTNNNGNNNTGGNTGGSTSADITVSGLNFTPSATTVAKGTTVNWGWNSCGSDGYGGQTCVDHSLVWDDGTPGLGATSSASYQRTFAAAGTYSYHCAIHGSTTAGMRGTVTVQ